jgi:phytoene dehydrogenase-like protein
LSVDAVVVGSGPNGLAAAIVLAAAGVRTVVREAAPVAGGGLRSEPLTLPGFTHDVCSAVHPLALSSPFFRSLPLEPLGLEWVQPAAALAHPFDDGTAAVLERSIDATVTGLEPDGSGWSGLHEPFARRWESLAQDLLAPPLRIPAHPLLLARFGLRAVRSATAVAKKALAGTRARALFAGNAAHSFLPLESAGTAAFGLLLGVAGHAVGWPIVRGGSQRFADALLAHFRALGGEVVTGARVDRIEEVDSARIVMLDLSPRQVLTLAGHRLPGGYRRALGRYRYGSAAFKVDWALSGPVPWRAPGCTRAATVHLGGTLEEVAASEWAHNHGDVHDRPFVLFVQPTLFDPSRAPPGKHVAWAYCHVPNGWIGDATDRIERQVERFAPGFRDLVIGRSVLGPQALEQRDANLIGGDISGGMMDLRQVFARPVARPLPYRTPLRGVYLCSASTPPGGGVHGMGGFHAARAALAELGIRPAARS